MFKTLASALKDKEIRKKILLVLLFLLIYRLGCFLPVPGLDATTYSEILENDSVGLLSLLNTVTGSALSNASFFALGVTPYINASIIVQLLTVGIPALERLSKQGDQGREKINLITKIVAIVLAIAQGLGIVLGYEDTLLPIFGENLLWLTGIMVVILLVAGTCFTMWIGDQITAQGIGNGLSLIIFVGIIASSAQSIANAIKSVFSSSINYLWELLGFIAMAVLMFALIVWVDGAERKIPVQYAKQVKGRKMYGGQSSHIPMKVNGTGVMPIIFATAIITFPSLIVGLFWPESNFASWWSKWMGTGTIIYSICVALLILFFSYFYAQMQFNPADVSLNIQQNGGFIPGIRPGKPTTDYLTRVSRRITLFGAIFLAFLALIPSVLFQIVAGGQLSLLNAFTATGMLIVVSCALEFCQQLDAQLMMKRHKNIL